MVENEIQFLSWEEFRQMAPSILQLEITRLGTLIDAVPEATDFRNLLVKARFELRQFITCILAADKETVAETCTPHLQTALLTVTLAQEGRQDPTLQYIEERFRYVHDRLPLIY